MAKGPMTRAEVHQAMASAREEMRLDKEKIYAELKRIAERSPVSDCQRLAICIMQTMELERDGKITTQLPTTHHT